MPNPKLLRGRLQQFSKAYRNLIEVAKEFGLTEEYFKEAKEAASDLSEKNKSGPQFNSYDQMFFEMSSALGSLDPSEDTYGKASSEIEMAVESAEDHIKAQDLLSKDKKDLSLKENCLVLRSLLDEFENTFFEIERTLGRLQFKDSEITNANARAMSLIWNDEASGLKYSSLARMFVSMRSSIGIALNHYGDPVPERVERSTSDQDPMSSLHALHSTCTRLERELRIAYASQWVYDVSQLDPEEMAQRLRDMDTEIRKDLQAQPSLVVVTDPEIQAELDSGSRSLDEGNDY